MCRGQPACSSSCEAGPPSDSPTDEPSFQPTAYPVNPTNDVSVSPTANVRKKVSVGVIAGAIGGGLGLLGVIILICYCIKRKKKPANTTGMLDTDIDVNVSKYAHLNS
jgi:hypothetical protein